MQALQQVLTPHKRVHSHLVNGLRYRVRVYSLSVQPIRNPVLFPANWPKGNKLPRSRKRQRYITVGKLCPLCGVLLNAYGTQIRRELLERATVTPVQRRSANDMVRGAFPGLR